MNRLAAICVKRPVFATVLILVLVVFGVFGYLKLGLDRFPKVDFPMITVTTRQPGSAAEEIERQITDKIEGAVNTIRRHRRAAVLVVRGHLAGLYHVRAGEGRRRGGAGRPRQGEPRAARLAQGRRAADGREDGPRLDADPGNRRFGPAAGDAPRHHGVLRQDAAAAIGDD